MDEHVIRTYVRAENRFVSGQGCELIDEHGTRYLDFLGGIAVNALGHAHPDLVAALQDQAAKLLHVSNLYRHEYTEPVAAKLAAGTGLEAAFFTNSGAEATEAALKLARKAQKLRGHAGRTGFVSLQHGFHGRTMGAISVTAQPAYRAPFEPLVPGCTYVPNDDVTALENALRTDPAPAALILEPIQGEGGIRPLDPDFLRAARRLCTETGTLLIHDEVQCGVGRTGKWLAADHAGTKPDIVTLAKPLAAGIPFGAMVVAADLAEVLVPGDHGSTFAGGPFACRAALVLLQALEDGLLAEVATRGAQLEAGLRALADRHEVVTEARGRGLMQGLVLREKAPDLQRALFERRLVTNCCAGDVVRFLPPYIVSSDQIDQALETVDACLREL